MPKAKPVYSVGELTTYIRHVLETDPLLQSVEVTGEISNLTYHGSGHAYFSLKDADAQISCAFFKNYNRTAPQLKHGDKVVVTGDISVYPPRGGYQLLVKAVRKQGVGDLYQQFQELKERLSAEGLFDPEKKRAIPRFPHSLVVITSPTGAALRDMLRTLYRRFPAVRITLIPALVQGEGSAASVIAALSKVGELAPDTVILARGGGSIEDLWTFNEEAVARAIAACPVPVVTGIGHETDFTIADFVADQRASTPTAAAELCTPDQEALKRELAQMNSQLYRGLSFYLDFRRQAVDELTYKMGALLRGSVNHMRQEAALGELTFRMESLLRQSLTARQQQLALLEAQLLAANPEDMLKKGYSLTLKHDKPVTSVGELAAGDVIDTIFFDGKVRSIVE